MRILFACGGTAGHINPALSIAATIKKRYPEAKILFAGNPKGMESRLIPQAGFDFVPFRAMGIQRRFTLKNVSRNIRSLGLFATSQTRARKLIRSFSPDIVVGTGGYVSCPIVLAAAKMRIPTAAHEQNAFPGVSNKLLAPHVDKMLLTVEQAKVHLPKGKNYIVTGNPVRPEILHQDREAARRKCGVEADQICILSFGGSLGAQTLNETIAAVMAWHCGGSRIHHIHATGQYGTELFPELLEQHGVEYKQNPHIDIREYIDDMPVCLAAADLVICRSGASTLSELTAAGKASILIPSPNVAENHQYHNAMVLVQADAAVMIEEKELTGERLIQTVQSLVENEARLMRLGENALKLGMPQAAERISEEILELLEK